MENESNYWRQTMRHRLSRRDLLRKGAMAGLSLAAAQSLLGCGQGTQSGQSKPSQASQAGQPKYGGVLKIGYVAHRGYLFPGNSTSGWDPNWLFSIGDGLVYTGSDGNPVPEASLAESWNRDDDYTYTFKLRQGIKFHDGTDYDAQAHSTYLDYLLDPKKSTAFGYRAQIDGIKSTEAVDKYTLRVRLTRRDPAFIVDLGGVGGVPASPTAMEKLGKDIIVKPALTGPFAVKSFVAGGEWVFEKNPNYWRKGLPYLDGINISEIPDERVRAASVQSGDLDVAFFTVANDVTENLKRDPNVVVVDANCGPTLMNINHALPPLDNLKIRQAVACCIDREATLKAAMQGLGTVTKGTMIPPNHWSYTDLSDVMYKFDINRAKELIKESGLKTPVSLKITTGDTPPDRPLRAQLLKGWLTEAGFDVSLEVFAGPESVRRMYDEGSYHISPSSYNGWPDPHPPFSGWCSSTGYYNAGHKSQDPLQRQVDDLINAAADNYDQKERKKLYEQLQRLLTQYVIATIPQTQSLVSLAYRRNIKGTEKPWVEAWATFRPQFFWKE